MKTTHGRLIICLILAGFSLNSWPNVATNFPSITSQPMSQTVGCGGQATFSVTASGSPPLSYFWTVNGHSLAFPATNSTLILSNVHFASGAQFVVTVSNALERIASEPAILTVTNPPMPLLSLICSPPFDHISWTDSCIPFTLYRTENVSDCITDWEPVQGALEVDGSTNTVTALQISDRSFYWLSMILPIVTNHPLSQIVTQGADLTLVAGATDPSCSPNSLTYQWRRNGILLQDQTNSMLQLTQIQRDEGGAYDVVVDNGINAVVSELATVRVTGQTGVVTLADDFDNRPLFGDVTIAIDGDNFNASKEPFEPEHAGSLGGKSVWIEWVAGQDGIVTVDTKGSAIDTLLGVYQGTNVAALTLVASDDDSGGFYTSEVQFNAVAGARYQIAVDGLAGSEGNIALNVNLEPTSDQIPQIIGQPESVTALTNSIVLFSVTNLSTLPPVTYQWRVHGSNIVDIPNATNSTLVISNPQAPAAYSVVVSNSVRGVVSQVAYLDLVFERDGDNALLPFTDVIEFKDKLEIRADSPPAAPREGVQARPAARSSRRPSPALLSRDVLHDAGTSSSEVPPFSVSRPRSKPRLHLSVAAGTISIASTRTPTTQVPDATVCNKKVTGTFYVGIDVTTSGTLDLDTQYSTDVDTILAVLLPTNATPWSDDAFPLDPQSELRIKNVLPAHYPTTIGVKPGGANSPIVLRVRM